MPATIEEVQVDKEDEMKDNNAEEESKDVDRETESKNESSNNALVWAAKAGEQEDNEVDL